MRLERVGQPLEGQQGVGTHGRRRPDVSRHAPEADSRRCTRMTARTGQTWGDTSRYRPRC